MVRPAFSQWLTCLYDEFDKLYRSIFDDACNSCPDHDCEGYVWLLPEEADVLVDAGVAVVELNGNANFIHSFPERNGQLCLDATKPPCVLRENRKCSIYPFRPLVCRMYPVGILTHDGEVVLALFDDCQYVRRMDDNQRASFTFRVLEIFEGLSVEATRELVDTYRNIDAISKLPEGLNNYVVIASVIR